MTLTTLEQEILSHLHTLALPQQREVLAFVRTLAATPVGVPGKELLAFAGAIEPHERDYNQYNPVSDRSSPSGSRWMRIGTKRACGR